MKEPVKFATRLALCLQNKGAGILPVSMDDSLL
jgi:hypothetical protein